MPVQPCAVIARGVLPRVPKIVALPAQGPRLVEIRDPIPLLRRREGWQPGCR